VSKPEKLDHLQGCASFFPPEPNAATEAPVPIVRPVEDQGPEADTNADANYEAGDASADRGADQWLPD